MRKNNFRNIAIIAHVEPLPLVPATWIIRKFLSGYPHALFKDLALSKPSLIPLDSIDNKYLIDECTFYNWTNSILNIVSFKNNSF